MSTRQTRVFVKSSEPPADWAETLIGRVFLPLTQEFVASLDWFWFSRYGSADPKDSSDCDILSIPNEYKLQPDGSTFHRSMRFRFKISDSSARVAFENRGAELIRYGGYRISDFRHYDNVHDTRNDRFLGIENRHAERAAQRATLTTNFYWATSRLVIDALVGPDGNGRFRMETNDDKDNNPRGSTFQSVLHLFCNITNAPTDVYVFQKASLSLLGFGTFMYPPEATPVGGWDRGATVFQLRY